MLETLEGWVWDKKAAKWEKNFAALKLFKEKYGHANVPSNYCIGSLKLGQWVNTVRSRQDQQVGERERRLNSLGFIWNTLDYKWDSKFELLRRYKNEFGTVEVAKNYEYEGQNLGQWTYIQRRDQKNLSRTRKELLQKIGFRFEEQDRLEMQWDSYLKAAVSFKSREGHLLVARGHFEDGLDLATWISTQRNSYKKDKLSEHRVKLLDSLNMIWDVPEYEWTLAFNALTKFKNREGHCQVPQKHKEADYPLGSWVSGRRQRWHQLTEEKQRLLLNLGFILKTRKSPRH